MLLEEYSYKDPIFSAESFIKKINNCPKIAVGVFAQSMEETFVKMFKPKVFTTMRCGGDLNVYEIEHNKKRILFYRSALGSPAAAAMMEELKCMGVECFLMSGTCGVLKPLQEYSLIVPNKAIRDEGTSYHYLPASDYVELNREVVDAIESYLSSQNIEFVEGVTWTTDAIYRETVDKTKKRMDMGAIVVEMECSAMASFAQHKGVKFGQILYSADVVIEGRHDLRSLLDTKPTSEEKIIDIIVDCASKIFD